MIMESRYNSFVIFTDIIAGLYRTVGNAYDNMINFANDTSAENTFLETISDLKGKIYVLVAVFMLFRITLTLIQYLVDPDKVSDKNVGASKMITRIVISLALVIGFPMITDNVLSKLQDALIGNNDSILYKFFEKNSSTGTNNGYDNAHSCEEHINNRTTQTCEINNDGKYVIVSNLNIRTEADCLNTVAMAKDLNQIEGNTLGGCTVTNELKRALETSYNILYSSTGENNKVSCSDGDCIGKYITTISQNKSHLSISTTADKTEAKKVAEKAAKKFNKVDTDLVCYSDSPGRIFAREVVANFTDKPEEIIDGQFLNCGGYDTNIEKRIEAGDIHIDVLICIICGIALWILMIILAMEVVIRNFKIIILQILAPIAFISYINPNDKVLENWFKKYVSCYLELFLKIFGINMAVFFIGVITAEDNFGGFNGLGKFLIILSLFTFAKTVPNFIGDILGIKDIGGSFKDSMKGLKTAAFMGAGAVAGGVAGAITGVGRGASFSTIAGGILGGMTTGALGGTNGFKGIGSSISNQSKKNNFARQSNLNGGNVWQRMLGKVGFDDATRADKNLKKLESDKKQYEELSAYKKNAEDIADSSNYMKDFASAIGSDGNKLHSAEEVKAERDKWISTQLAVKKSLETYGPSRYSVDQDGNILELGSSIGMKYEGGKAAALATQVRDAEIVRSSSKMFTNDNDFSTTIDSWNSFVEADKKAKIKSTALGDDILKVRSSDEYRAADASRNNGGNH